jgi:RNA polymerase sigma factor (sigma-70 family)
VSMRELSDEDLVREAQAGDDAAFATLYARHQRAVHARCLRVLRDHDEAADAAQNAMVSALRALRSNGAPDHPRGWLLAIAHNEAVSLLRRSHPAEPLEAGHAGAGPGADEGAFERERLRQLVDDLHALPERQRGALLLREASGYSYRHIASVLGTSTGNARQTVHAARRNLHKRRVGREHGWLGFALPGLAAAWLVRTLGLEELAANLTGAGKAALLAGALVACGGAVTQLGGGSSGALLGAAAPTGLADPPQAQALAALPRRLAEPHARPAAAAGAARKRVDAVATSSPVRSSPPPAVTRRRVSAPVRRSAPKRSSTAAETSHGDARPTERATATRARADCRVPSTASSPQQPAPQRGPATLGPWAPATAAPAPSAPPTGRGSSAPAPPSQPSAAATSTPS